MTRQLLLEALTRSYNPDRVGGYDQVTAARIAEDCLAIFTHEIEQVTPSIRPRHDDSDSGHGEHHGEDFLLVPNHHADLHISEDEFTTEALARQGDWYRALGDDVI